MVVDGELTPLPALDLGPQICSDFERGLLGVAVDPAFATNRFIYLYYTFDAHGVCSRDTPSTDPHNRVVRYVLGQDDRAAPSTERILIDELPSRGGNHNAGDLQFGKDGMLYVSVGDGGRDYAGTGSGANNDASRDPHVLLGKVLRITPEGVAPQDNPFASSPDADACALQGMTSPGRLCRATFLSGFRNPFRMAFDPNAAGVRFYVNDVGHTAYEEVDEAIPGADYGWNYCEGLHDNGGSPGVRDCASPPLTPPVHEYAHTTGCASITGGAFVPVGVWPSEYDGAYIYSDYVCGRMFLLRPTADGLRRSDFATGLGSSSAVTLGFGPADGTQALYYTTFAEGGQIRRVRYGRGSAGRPPQVVLDAFPRSGPVPLDVRFDTSRSTDPDGDPFSFEYDFGDGSRVLATADTEVRHTYRTESVYTATVVGIDSHGARSQPAGLRISAGNDAPEVEIATPAADDQFVVGQRVVLRGSATDAEDGPLPPESLSWSVTLQHNTHQHPFVPPTTGAAVTFTTPPPEDLSAVSNSYLFVTLTATDTEGIETSLTRQFDPHIVDLQFETEPTGLTVDVEGISFDGPATVRSWECDRLEVNAPDQQVEDASYSFRSWSDGGLQQHQIVTPSEPTTYKASFTEGGSELPEGANAEPRTAERVGGPSRVATAIALSQERFTACPGTAGSALAETVVLARADQYPDALAGGPLAAAQGAPVLLTGSDTLAPETAAEIERLGARRVVLLGGVSALSNVVADDLRGRGVTVERIAGNDRFDTARLIAAVLPPSEQAYVVEGANSDPDRGWPDAVSASWLAARQGVPILLTNRVALPATTRRALMERQVARATVVGGVAAVSEEAFVSVSQVVPSAERVAGETRYETSRMLADRAGPLEGATVFLATGTAFPDALAAGPSVAGRAGVLLLLHGDSLDQSPPARDWLAQNGPVIGGAVLVGQEDAINTTVENEVRALLNPAP
jgi:putative cell wall-binding protein/PKD repeat protein